MLLLSLLLKARSYFIPLVYVYRMQWVVLEIYCIIRVLLKSCDKQYSFFPKTEKGLTHRRRDKKTGINYKGGVAYAYELGNNQYQRISSI